MHACVLLKIHLHSAAGNNLVLRRDCVYGVTNICIIRLSSNQLSKLHRTVPYPLHGSESLRLEEHFDVVVVVVAGELFAIHGNQLNALKAPRSLATT